MDGGGLARAGIVEVVKQGGVAGALYRTIGRDGPSPDRAPQLSQGNIAVLTSSGVRAELNTWDTNGRAIMGEAPRTATPAARRPWLLWSAVVVFLAWLAGYAVWF